MFFKWFFCAVSWEDIGSDGIAIVFRSMSFVWFFVKFGFYCSKIFRRVFYRSVRCLEGESKVEVLSKVFKVTLLIAGNYVFNLVFVRDSLVFRFKFRFRFREVRFRDGLIFWLIRVVVD